MPSPTTSKIEKLIHLVRKNQCLYDSTCPEHKDATRLQNIWKEQNYGQRRHGLLQLLFLVPLTLCVGWYGGWEDQRCSFDTTEDRLGGLVIGSRLLQSAGAT